MNNINTEILNFLTYSKNLITNQPYQITFNGDTVCMFKLLNCERNLKYILRIRLNATVGWITKTDRLCGFIIHVGNKQKKFYSDDSSILFKFKELLACKVSFYNVYEFYDFKEQIGKGASSRVVKAFCKFTYKFVAIKIIDKTTLKPLNYASLEQEIEILLKVKDSIYCSQIIEIYQSQYAFYIVMRLLSGQSLSTYLENQQGEIQKKLTNKQILQIMRRLLEGVNYLHSVGIIHRDIKPDNLMLAEYDNFDTITLIDFGLSTFTKVNRYLFYKCGTPGYVAPEILNSAVRNQQSESCDIFSCGCIFYRLITGKNVFKGRTYDELLHKNKQCLIDFSVKQEQHSNQNAIKLLHSMLRKNPDERITAKAALQSSYFYNESLFSINDENWDSSPLVNQLPHFTATIGKVFQLTARDFTSQKLIIPRQKDNNFYSPQLSPIRRDKQ
ncbi:unnamed protein product [Paramecium octaurelia]|uniref:Protein kinase domain-containing protein n=1 Tax=Paramecium octaurelia TaxID=43137 RepID=A0A8S1U7K6_PAROT|nr:unnamed protein product [Paramecium octaurelia]